MTEKSPASMAHVEQPTMDLATSAGTHNIQPGAPAADQHHHVESGGDADSKPDGGVKNTDRPPLTKAETLVRTSNKSLLVNNHDNNCLLHNVRFGQLFQISVP